MSLLVVATLITYSHTIRPYLFKSVQELLQRRVSKYSAMLASSGCKLWGYVL